MTILRERDFNLKKKQGLNRPEICGGSIVEAGVSVEAGVMHEARVRSVHEGGAGVRSSFVAFDCPFFRRGCCEIRNTKYVVDAAKYEIRNTK